MILLAFEDVTERRAAAKRLSDYEARFRLIFESVKDFSIFTTDLDGIITSWNKGAENVFGYCESEAIGQTAAILFTPEDRADRAPARELTLAARDGQAAAERLHLKKDGGRFFASGMVTPITEDDGSLIGFTKVARDITLQKELERSLRHRARELAEGDRRKNEFLAMLAHELRNPLAAIHNGVNLVRMPGAERHLPDVLAVIARQATHLTRLIDDLLDVSRITQGKVELKLETTELAAVIRRAIETVRPLIERRNHELILQLTARPIPVQADPTRLEQIIGNLLINAAKYSPNGGQITVSAAREGGEAMIRVSDTGLGISPEMLPKIFDLFAQVDPTLARSEGGLGIGLTLVKQLVEMHGGGVTAESEVGKGSTSTIRLPALGTPSEEATPTPSPQVDGAGRKVLIVDDNAQSAHLLSMILEMLGFAVQIRYDGKSAIELATVYHPEVVLLDIGLPGIDGYAVARQLRQEPCCRDSLIVGVSGYGDRDARELAEQAGFDHYLVKPVDIVALTEVAASRRLEAVDSCR
jgi:PAS domain S-box-containing protein